MDFVLKAGVTIIYIFLHDLSFTTYYPYFLFLNNFFPKKK